MSIYKNIYRYNFDLLTNMLIVIVPIVCLFILNVGITNPDGVQYLLTSGEWAKNGVDLHSQSFYSFIHFGPLTEYRFNSSIFVTLPLTCYFIIFGYTGFTLKIYSLIVVVLCAFLLKYFVKSLFNATIANTAVLIYLLIPINYYMLGSFLADSYSNLWLLLILSLFLFGIKREPTPLYLFSVLLSGLLTVLSTFVRQWLPIVFLINILLFWIFYRKKTRLLIIYLSGCIAGVLSFFIIGKLLSGDYLFFIKLYTEYSGEISRNLFFEYPVFILPQLLQSDHFSFIFLLVLFLVPYSFRHKNRNNVFLLLWLVIFYLFFEVLIRLVLNLPRYAGYLNILLIPSIVFLANYIYTFFSEKKIEQFLLLVYSVFLIILITFNYLDFGTINTFVYSYLGEIRRYSLLFFIGSVCLVTLFINRNRILLDFSASYRTFIKAGYIMSVSIMVLFSAFTVSSRSYESNCLKQISAGIAEENLPFYFIHTPDYSVKCTNSTVLMPYYKYLSYTSEKGKPYSLKMISDFKEIGQNGYFIFSDKGNSLNWKAACAGELDDFIQKCNTNNILVRQVSLNGNYSLWKIELNSKNNKH